MTRYRNDVFTLCLVLVSFIFCAGSLAAQDLEQPAEDLIELTESDPSGTAFDPEMPVENLTILLRPMLKEDLEAEAEHWMQLVRDKIREVSEVELQLSALPEGTTDEKLTVRLVELKQEETSLIERMHLVLEALASKGGDVSQQQQYLTAVSSLSETTDSVSYRAALIAYALNWLEREDGGVYWLKRAGFSLIILFVFWLFSKVAGRVACRLLTSRMNVSTLLENFTRRTAGGVVMVVGVLTAISTLGVEVGPLMAALGAGGFIVGFALQETLASFASGLMIMVYRPFDVDDYVDIAGVQGTVQAMSLVSTTLITLDNKVVVIPNQKAWGETIINYSGRELRRVDLVFGIGYEDNIEQALNVLQEIAKSHELVLAEPDVTVHVDTLGDSAVNLFCRPWVKTSDYWTVHWDLTREVKERFDAEGISIPFPQRDVHIHEK